jgi:hypothetical protein
MQDLRCKECGQSFKSPSDLEEHRERVHASGEAVPMTHNPRTEVPRD